MSLAAHCKQRLSLSSRFQVGPVAWSLKGVFDDFTEFIRPLHDDEQALCIAPTSTGSCLTPTA